jgi:hypothetical protein
VGGTSKKRPSPHLSKVPTQNNEISPLTFQNALVCSRQRKCLHSVEKETYLRIIVLGTGLATQTIEPFNPTFDMCLPKASVSRAMFVKIAMKFVP